MATLTLIFKSGALLAIKDIMTDDAKRIASDWEDDYSNETCSMWEYTATSINKISKVVFAPADVIAVNVHI